MSALEKLRKAIEPVLPAGWEVRTREHPSFIIAFNPKFGTMGILRIDVERDFGRTNIRFYPHRVRKYTDANVSHFAKLFSDEAVRLEGSLTVL